MRNEEKIIRLIEGLDYKVERGFEAMEAKMSGMNADVGGLKTDVAGLKTDVADIKKSQETMSDALLYLDVRMDAMEGIPARVTRLERIQGIA